MPSIKSLLYIIFNTLRSCLRVAVRSVYRNRCFAEVKRQCPGGECVILGNGPSLSGSLVRMQTTGFLRGKRIVCVNDFACSPVYEAVKPDYYVFADPAYWRDDVLESLSKQREQTFNAIITKTQWVLTLFLPFSVRGSRFLVFLLGNPNIRICFFNTTPVEGAPALRHWLYRHDLAMPSPQNVVIPALLLALNLGFRKLFLFGADHSWHESIIVGSDNVLYLKGFARFFEGEVRETLVPVTHENGGAWKLHDLFQALMITFRSYHELNAYAEVLGAEILNASTKTYIDAFRRYQLDHS